jgi:hypothetical protein
MSEHQQLTVSDDAAAARPDRRGPFALLVRNFLHGLFESDPY